MLTTRHMPLETCLTVLVVSLLAFFFASGSCHAILIKCLLLKFRRRYAAPCL